MDSERDIKLDGDLGEVERGPDLTRGTYLARVQDIEVRVKRDRTGEYLRVDLQVVDVLEGAQESLIGAPIQEFLSLSKGARWKIAMLMDAVHDKEVTGDTIRVAEIVGRLVVVRGGPEEYRGRERFRVQKFLPLRKWPRPITAPAVDESGGGAAGNGAAEIPF